LLFVSCGHLVHFHDYQNATAPAATARSASTLLGELAII